MKEIQYTNRDCDCCGSSKLETIWEYQYKSKTRNNLFLWSVNNVVCQNCGFAFVSPVPTDESIEAYYKDAFRIASDQQIDYSIAKRLKIIKKHQNRLDGKSYLEVGSNNCPEFIEAVSAIFDSVETVELNRDCDSSYRHTDEIPNGSIDMITSYFVLEHVPKPKAFLSSCHRVLKQNGIAIVEIPNLYMYPKDPAGLFLYEHVNHFSPNSFSILADSCGFETIEISQLNCSRPFGFTSVLQKKASAQSPKRLPSPNEAQFASACIREGKEVINHFHKRLDDARQKITKTEQKAIVWGANEICASLLKEQKMWPSVIIVDKDPNKKDYFKPHTIYLPSEVIDEIKQSNLLIINTKRHELEILNWILVNTGRGFDSSNCIVLDYLK